ncbi:MAG: peptidoglycan DD-metalloendopeptidase family protein [Proteobacteria bacterium]|nr:peptidoglycan DD-metalloendopeptidase family protein [Pseudomonadota bacterium]
MTPGNRRFLRALVVLLCCLALPAVPRAESPGDIQEKLDARRGEIKNLESREKDVVAEMEAASRTASEAREKIRVIRADMDALSEKIVENEAAVRDIRATLPGLTERAGKRLAAYYRLSRTGTAPFLFSSGSLYDLAVRQRALTAVLAADQRLFADLSGKREALDRAKAGLVAEKQHLAALTAGLETQVQSHEAERAKKEALAALIRQDRTLVLAAARALEEAARHLAEELAAREKPSSPPPPRMVPEGAEGLAALKGRLLFPVEGGRLASAFGSHTDPRTGIQQFRSGVIIAATPGDPVRAVFGGKVVYSGWFSGYGNMIIIDHGQGYFTVCAHAEDLFKEKGDPVESGEVVGTVGDTGVTVEPGLYFELRLHQTPLDPALWLQMTGKGSAS